jgi:hypothetical protein
VSTASPPAQAAAALLYTLIAVFGAFPQLTRHLDIGHALVQHFMAGEGRAQET